MSSTKDIVVRRLYVSYMIGFTLSLILTLGAFGLVMYHIDTGQFQREFVFAVLAITAVTQLIVQLVFFFHLGREPKPRLNTVSFLFMTMVVVIIGFGSLWIMYNLNYNMMPHEVETYIQEEENIKLEKTEHSH